MRLFLPELFKRNKVSFWLGWFHFLMCFFCLGLMSFNHNLVNGENAWAKPARYFLASGITTWTLGWFFYYVQSKSAVKISGILCSFSLLAGNGIIFLQSKRGVASHYNVSTPFDAMMFSSLVACMILFLLGMLYFSFVFFTQKKMPISQHFTWGIKMGLLNFMLFSVCGLIMLARMSHLFGGQENGAGFPIVNWSHKHGDLRIALFMGVHSLQIIPLLSYYLFTKKIQVINFSVLYFIATLSFMILAMLGIPVLG